MTPNYPHHSDDAFMENATPVQSFVVRAIKMGPEERARPRYGRPQRKPEATQISEPPESGDPPSPPSDAKK